MRLLLIFVAQFLLCLLDTLNHRATAKYKMKLVLVSDAATAALWFTLVKWITEATSKSEQVVYVAGAVVGSYLGMKLTERWEKRRKPTT